MKNLLIVLDSMNCGGVETYVYSLTKILKKYCNIFVVSNGGELVEILEKNKIKHFQIDLSNFNHDKIEKNKNEIVNIINDNKIDVVNIHPFMTYYPSVWACIESRVPYVLTIHDAIGRNVLEYIDDFYTLFLQSIVYKFASKIILVSEECKEKYTNEFCIDENKISIIHNSIDCNNFKQVNKSNNISKFLIVSRLDIDKKMSILNSIDLYIYIVNKLNIKNNCSLKIAGVGSEYKHIEEYINKNQDYNIMMLGNVVDMPKLLNEADIVLGMGRSLLEGVFCKRVCILSGYDNLKCLVSKNNIIELSTNNFSGRNHVSKNKEEIYDEIVEFMECNLDYNLEECYNLAKNNFELNINGKRIWDIFKNIKNQNENIFSLKVIEEFFSLRKKMMVFKDSNVKLLEENKCLNIKNANLINEKIEASGVIEKLQYDLELYKSNIKNTQDTLNKIYNSRMWKIAIKYYKFRDFLKINRKNKS